MTIDIHIIEVDLASEYDIIDLDILEAKSRVRMDIRGHESIEAASVPYTMSQHSPRSSGGLGS